MHRRLSNAALTCDLQRETRGDQPTDLTLVLVVGACEDGGAAANGEAQARVALAQDTDAPPRPTQPVARFEPSTAGTSAPSPPGADDAGGSSGGCAVDYDAEDLPRLRHRRGRRRDAEAPVASAAAAGQLVNGTGGHGGAALFFALLFAIGLNSLARCALQCGGRPRPTTATATRGGGGGSGRWAPAAAKRMWSSLRAVFFMMRKGVLSNKRKVLLGMHLLMKRRNKAVVAELLSHHGHGHHANALRRRDYESFCSNSPDPAAFSASRRRLAYFPCLGAMAKKELAASPAPPLAGIEYYATASPATSSPGLLPWELAPEEEYHCASPALQLGGAGTASPCVSNYSSEDDEAAAAGSEAVDDEADVRRPSPAPAPTSFYEQRGRRRQGAVPFSWRFELQGGAAFCCLIRPARRRQREDG
ncbi:hypothetical protein ACP70R_012451 [Stipagrostis hirtigluma subsp. patula]